MDCLERILWVLKCTVNERQSVRKGHAPQDCSTRGIVIGQLPLIHDCSNCGVCCYHMGYPAFMLPRESATDEQIDRDPELQRLLAVGWTRDELKVGHPGESHWHNLPSDLKKEWQAYVATYDRPGELDGKCFWLDLETNLCKHHQHRPQVCRDFEAGSKECHHWRRHFNVT